MKKLSLFLLTFLFVILLPACTKTPTPAASDATQPPSHPTPEYLAEGPERDAILIDSDVFIQHIVDGIAENDYASFSEDFDATMLNSLKVESFDQVYAIYGPLGKSSAIELFNVEVAGDYYAVRYKVKYPSKILIMRVVVDKNDPRKVSGLWFE